MAFFKKKNETEETTENKELDIKEVVLQKLNEQLKGTLYDNCIIMPRGFTIDVKIGRRELKEDIHILQVVFIVSNDEFDEPIIEPVDSQGQTEEEAAELAVNMFKGGLWHPLEQSTQKKNGIHIPVSFLNQRYDFDMYAQSIVRIGVKNKEPIMLLNFIKNEIPKYLGSKKYYWIRVYLAKYQDKEVIEVRVNGSVCNDLKKYFQAYVNSWDASETFLCEKQYGIFVNRAEDACPFKKELITDAAKAAIEKMVKIENREGYLKMADELEELTGNAALAAEIRIFVPEILAKLTLGYQEGDSLFLLEGDANSEQGESRIEFRKSQLRSYFYIQQVLIEYLSTQPPKEDVQRIVFNSVAFRELRKATEQGHEVKDLFVPGTAYKIGKEGYRIW